MALFQFIAGCHSLFGELLQRFRVLGKVGQSHAPQHVRRLCELDIVVAHNLDPVAPRIAEVEKLPRQHLNAGCGQRSARSIFIIDHKAEVATVSRGLSVALLKRNKLIAEIDEGRALAFTAKLEAEYPSVKYERFLRCRLLLARYD